MKKYSHCEPDDDLVSKKTSQPVASADLQGSFLRDEQWINGCDRDRGHDHGHHPDSLPTIPDWAGGASNHRTCK